MAKHLWVEIQFTPVQTERQADGSVHIYTTEEAKAVAGEEAQYGCWFCSETLDIDNLDEECPGENLDNPTQ